MKSIIVLLCLLCCVGCSATVAEEDIPDQQMVQTSVQSEASEEASNPMDFKALALKIASDLSVAAGDFEIVNEDEYVTLSDGETEIVFYQDGTLRQLTKAFDVSATGDAIDSEDYEPLFEDLREKGYLPIEYSDRNINVYPDICIFNFYKPSKHQIVNPYDSYRVTCYVDKPEIIFYMHRKDYVNDTLEPRVSREDAVSLLEEGDSPVDVMLTVICDPLLTDDKYLLVYQIKIEDGSIYYIDAETGEILLHATTEG